MRIELFLKPVMASLLPLLAVGVITAQQREGALINGQVALRFSEGNHGSTYVLLQKLGDEDALVVPVIHYHAVLYAQAPGCRGLLYITQTRIAYDSQTKKEHSFNLLRAEIKKAESQKSGRFGKNIGNHIFIDGRGGERRFAVAFENESNVGFQGDYMKPVLAFLDMAIRDFGTAARDFDGSTHAARQAQTEAKAQTQLRAEADARARGNEAKFRENYEKEFAEALSHKDELVRSLSPQTISAARDAVRSLRKIAGATEIGVTAEQYGSRLIDLKADVDEVVSRMPNNALKIEFQLALEAYVDAHQAWSWTLSSKGDSLFPDIEPGTTLMRKYSIPIDTSIGMPLLPRQRVLSVIWADARKHVDRASLLLAQ